MNRARVEPTIGVFAKAPIAGHAKTRLIPALGAEGAAALHARLVGAALRTATSAAAGQVELWCAPHRRHAFFAECARDWGVVLRDQPEGDLGTRMAAFFRAALGPGGPLAGP